MASLSITTLLRMEAEEALAFHRPGFFYEEPKNLWIISIAVRAA